MAEDEQKADAPQPIEETAAAEEQHEAAPAAEMAGVEADAVEADDETPARVRKPRRRRKQQPNEKDLTPADVVAFFAGCGRCSFFLAGYQLLFEEGATAEALEELDNGYIIFEWDQDVRQLLHKSFGVRIDVDHYHYEARCQECSRHFVFQAARDEDDTDDLRVALRPEPLV